MTSTATATAPVALPRKTRELHNHHFDSTVWNDFPFRDDDIIVSTYAKSGTTWVQQIISQLQRIVGQVRFLQSYCGPRYPEHPRHPELDSGSRRVRLPHDGPRMGPETSSG